jgi:hypothetical protein
MSILEIHEPEAPALILGPRLAGTLMAAEEFDAALEADEGFSYELIHGVFIVTPPPLEEERGPNEELGCCDSTGCSIPRVRSSMIRCPSNTSEPPATAAGPTE